MSPVYNYKISRKESTTIGNFFVSGHFNLEMSLDIQYKVTYFSI